MILLELAIFAGALWWAARRIDGRVLVGITLGSFALRLLIGEGLYFASLLHAPLLREAQLPGGFWSFASDAASFDAAGKHVAAALPYQGPAAIAPHGVYELVGTLYFLFGSNPSTVLIFNAGCSAACVLFVWILTCQAGMPRQAVVAAALLAAIWPSSFAWSGQLLKDSWEWFGTFAVLGGAALVLSEGSLIAGVGCLLAGGAITWILRGYALVGFGVGLAVALVAFLFRNRDAWPRPAVLGVVLVAGLALNLGALRTFMGPVVSQGIAQATSAAASPADLANYTAAELAVWNARPDLRQYYTGQYPGLSPIDDMDLWLHRDDVHVDVEQYAGELTGQDYANGTFPPVEPHGIAVCPPLSRLINVRLRFNANGGGSLIDGGRPFHSCGDILADIPHALAVVLLYPLPGAWVAGRAVGAVRYLSALDALLLWAMAPGLIVGALNSFRRRTGVNSALTLGIVLLGVGMGLAVTNFGTLFRIRLELLLPGVVLAADGWFLLLGAVARLRQQTAARGLLLYASKGFQGR